MGVYLWVFPPPRTLKKSRCDGLTFTFTDPVQTLSLHFVFVGQGHGVKRSTAQDSTAQRGTSPPQPQILPRFRLLVHCQLYSPGHNASVYTPARQKNKNTKTLGSQDAQNSVVRAEQISLRKALKNPWQESRSCSQSAGGNRYGNHTYSHTQAISFGWWQSAPFAQKVHLFFLLLFKGRFPSVNFVKLISQHIAVSLQCRCGVFNERLCVKKSQKWLQIIKEPDKTWLKTKWCHFSEED